MTTRGTDRLVPCTATSRGDARLGGASPRIHSGDTATHSVTADSPRCTVISPLRLVLLSSLSLALVRTRHPVWPPLIMETLQAIVLAGQKDLIHALSADHTVADYELQSPESTHRYR
jgi:hypothetical protein